MSIRGLFLIGLVSITFAATTAPGADNGNVKEFIGRGYAQVSYQLNGKSVAQPGSYASVSDVSFEINGAATVLEFCGYVTKAENDFSYICVDTAGIYEADYYKARRHFKVLKNEIAGGGGTWQISARAQFPAPGHKTCSISRETTFSKQNSQIVIRQKATLCAGNVIQREVVLSK